VKSSRERPNYPAMVLWTSVFLHIGIGAWCFGMAIHNDWAVHLAQGAATSAIVLKCENRL
jgi:hypothetical protein